MLILFVNYFFYSGISLPSNVLGNGQVQFDGTNKTTIVQEAMCQKIILKLQMVQQQT